jgi:nucleoid DNA-binding protein
MDITPFIRELLFSHDCVIVPGFGGFIGNYTPARIDKSTSTFFPPVKQISFNRNLNHNDGLLVGRISEHLKVNYGDGRNIVEEFVASLRKKLQGGEKITFDNIGIFVNNQEGNVQFEPDCNVNYHLDSYGLESFQFPLLEGYDVRKRIARHIDKDPVSRTTVRKIIWRAAVIIPLLAMIVTVTLKPDLFKSKVEATSLNPLVTAEFENNKKAIDNNTVSVPEVPIENNLKTDLSIPEIKSPVVEAENNYCIVTGSFKLKGNADKQVNMLKEDGFAPEIIDAPNGFLRVSAVKCSDLKTAEGKRDSISKKYPDTWIKRI